MITPLHQEMHRLIRIQKLHETILGASWGVVAALGLGVSLAVAARIAPLWHRQELLLILGVSILAGSIMGLLGGAGWPRAHAVRLQQLDRRLHLANRLITTWELETGRIIAPPSMQRHQAEETLSCLQKIDPHPAFPFRPTKTAGITALLLALLLIPLLLAPNPQEAVLVRREMLQQAAKAEAEKLEQTIETLRQDPTINSATRQAALEALEKALETLRSQDTSSEEQQQALLEAEKQLAELRTPETAMSIQHLAESAPLSTETVIQPLAQALEQGDLETAAAYLRSLTDPQGEPLSQEEALALADAFASMASALQETEPDIARKLREISQEIYTGDLAGTQEALNQAAEVFEATDAANASNAAVEAAQAQLQEATNTLAEAQGAALGQSGGTPQSSAGNTQGAAGPGGQTAGTGPGIPGHNEDSGSSPAYGEETAPRIEGQGGDITIPRETTEGLPHLTEGLPSDSRIPYRDVYATYAEAAEAELSQRSLPPALRSYVRDYFSMLGE